MVDIAFNTAYPLSGVRVSDSNGNWYWPVFAGHAPGSADFLCCYVAAGCTAGPNTITLTQVAGQTDFQAVSVTIHEYSGLAPNSVGVAFGVASANGIAATITAPAPVFAVWMHGCTVNFDGADYQATYIDPTHLWLSPTPPSTPAAAWLITEPPLNYGYSYTCLTGLCDAVTYDGGPDANVIPETIVTSEANEVLHLLAASMPNCSGVGVPGGGVPPPVGVLSITAGPFRWKSKVSVHDLFNAVKGTYISPASNWQPTDFPPYMQDALHGYAGDANLAADNNERRYLDIQLPFTISGATAQPLAKIELLRRRNQGTGTFQFNLYGLQMTVLDVITMTLAFFNWTNKLLEVLAFRFTLNAKQDGDQRVIALGTEIDVQETDPSIYNWSTAEELTPQGYQQGAIPNPQNIAAPTSVALVSNGTTSIVGADGVARSRIQVNWTAPADGYATELQIQFQVVASPQSSVWTAGPTVPVSVTVAYLDSVVDGTSYYVQIRSVNAAGVASAWSQAGPVTVGGTASQLFTVNGA